MTFWSWNMPWLRTRTEEGGKENGFSALPAWPNPKSEIRNPKQIRMTEKGKFKMRSRRKSVS